MKGLHYLRMLLDRPGLDLPATEMAAAGAGHPGETLTDGGTGELLDRHAVLSYRQRLADIDAELDDADDRGNATAAERLHAERAALLAELRAAAGLGGRTRTTSGNAERARVAVRKAISGAIKRLEPVDPYLARVLIDTVTTGATCRYEPDPGRPVTWVLESPSP